MGLGRLWTRQASPPGQHSRMIVGSGFRLGPNAILGDASADSAWRTSHYGYAVSIPGVWRAANLIADLIGRLPWDAFTTHGRDQAEVITPTPPLLDQPNPTETRMDTFSAWTLDLLLHGNAIGLIAERNAAGWPTAVLPVSAQWVSVRRVNDSTYSAIPSGAVEYQIGGQTFSADDVIHIKGPHAPGALRGMGVLEYHWHTLDVAHEQRRQAGNVAAGAVPLGVLEATNPDITPEDMADTKATFLASQRDRTVAALANAKFTPIAWNPTDGQMIEARQYTLTELALIFGLPPSFLAAPSGGSMDYTSTELEALQLLKFSAVAGHVARFEQTLSLAFPRGTVVKVNLDALLRSDTVTRYQAHEIGIRAGFLRRSEVRRLEDLPPVPGIDDQPKPPVVAPDAAVQPPATNGHQIGAQNGRRIGVPA